MCAEPSNALSGLDPLTGRAYYETRLAVLFGLVCVACGAISGVVGDALLPQSTQAPLAAIATCVRTALGRSSRASAEEDRELTSRHELLGGSTKSLRYDDASDSGYESSTDEPVAEDEPRRGRSAALALLVAGPALALLGARLDDPGGLSGRELARSFRSPAALVFGTVSAGCALGLPAQSVVASALTSALASAWAHVAVKALVEACMHYGSRGAAAAAVWLCALAVPVLVCLKLRAVAQGLHAFPPDLFLPVYQALAIASNAAAGLFVFDDTGFLAPGPRATPPDPPLTPLDVAAYGLGLASTVAGVLLTAAEGSDWKSRPPPLVARRRRDESRLDVGEDQKADPAGPAVWLGSGHAASTPHPPRRLGRGPAYHDAASSPSWDDAAAEAATSAGTIVAGLPPGDDDIAL